jgi:hypothetical protein
MGRNAALVLTVVVLMASCGGSAAPASQEPRSQEPSLSTEEFVEQFGVTPAELEDLKFVASEEGWTLAEAFDRIGWQQSFSVFLQEVRETYPDDYAGAAILFDEGPRNVFIAFRSTVPPEVRDDPRLAHLDVEFREMSGYSEEELNRQVVEVHQAMLEAGFANVGSGPDIETGIVRIEAELRDSDFGKPDADILAGLPAAARANNVVVVFYDELPEVVRE